MGGCCCCCSKPDTKEVDLSKIPSGPSPPSSKPSSNKSGKTRVTLNGGYTLESSLADFAERLAKKKTTYNDVAEFAGFRFEPASEQAREKLLPRKITLKENQQRALLKAFEAAVATSRVKGAKLEVLSLQTHAPISQQRDSVAALQTFVACRPSSTSAEKHVRPLSAPSFVWTGDAQSVASKKKLVEDLLRDRLWGTDPTTADPPYRLVEASSATSKGGSEAADGEAAALMRIELSHMTWLSKASAWQLQSTNAVLSTFEQLLQRQLSAPKKKRNRRRNDAHSILKSLYGAEGAQARIALGTVGRGAAVRIDTQGKPIGGGNKKGGHAAKSKLLDFARLEDALLLARQVAEHEGGRGMDSAVPEKERTAADIEPLVLLFKQLRLAESGRKGRKPSGDEAKARACADLFCAADGKGEAGSWVPLVALQHKSLTTSTLLCDALGACCVADPTAYEEAPLFTDVARLAGSILIRCVPLTTGPMNPADKDSPDVPSERRVATACRALDALLGGATAGAGGTATSPADLHALAAAQLESLPPPNGPNKAEVGGPTDWEEPARRALKLVTQLISIVRACPPCMPAVTPRPHAYPCIPTAKPHPRPRPCAPCRHASWLASARRASPRRVRRTRATCTQPSSSRLSSRRSWTT